MQAIIDFLMSNTTATTALVTFLVTALLSLFVFMAGRRRKAKARSQVAKDRAARAQAGEKNALSLLSSSRWIVVDQQPTRTVKMRANGEVLTYQVRPDLLIRDAAGRLFVADVKTGSKAPDPKHTPTRRQLREYLSIFAKEGVVGVVLVDVEMSAVIVIEFMD